MGDSLKGKKVLIVGVGPGLGSATAYLLLKEGAEVIISSREEGKLKEICKSLSRVGNISYVAGNASSLNGASEIISAAVKNSGRIDHFVFSVGGYVLTRLSDANEENLESMLSSNFKAPIYLAKAALPHLSEGSSIVLVCSREGLQWHTTRNISYAPAKAALARATEILANELLEKGVRVNAVAPASMRFDFSPERDWRKGRRLGDVECPPEDVASVISFLLGESSGWIDGVVIPVDGGSRFNPK